MFAVPIIIVERILELCIGLITVISFRQRFKSGGLSQKELITRIEQQDREIEKLRIEKRQLKAHHTYRRRHTHVLRHA